MTLSADSVRKLRTVSVKCGRFWTWDLDAELAAKVMLIEQEGQEVVRIPLWNRKSPACSLVSITRWISWRRAIWERKTIVKHWMECLYVPWMLDVISSFISWFCYNRSASSSTSPYCRTSESREKVTTCQYAGHWLRTMFAISGQSMQFACEVEKAN